MHYDRNASSNTDTIVILVALWDKARGELLYAGTEHTQSMSHRFSYPPFIAIRILLISSFNPFPYISNYEVFTVTLDIS